MKIGFLKSFIPAFQSKKRYLFLQGGRGSGKSQFAIRKIIYRMLVESNSNFLACRSTNTALRKSLWRAFPKILHEIGVEYDISKTEQIIKFKNGNEIVFVGLDDPDRIKSLEGINGGAIIEEGLEITRSQFDAVDSIVRGQADYAQVITAYNPDRKTSFIYSDFWQNKPDNAVFHISTIDDNKYLANTEYVSVLDSIKDTEKRKSWRLGEWASLGDLVIENYIVEKFDKSNIIRKGSLFAGVDWGFKNPSAFLLLAEYDNDIYIIDEVYEREMQTTDFINLVKEMLKEYEINESNIDCFPENAEPDRNELLDDNTGMYIHPIKKDKQGEIVILKEHNIIISPDCEETIKEIGSWSYAKDKDGNPLDKPAKGLDHAMDALCYAGAGYFRNLSLVPAIY